MIPADILTAILAIALIVIPPCLMMYFAVRDTARKRARPVEPETHGDQGGMPVEPRRAVARPKAPKTGSGLPIGMDGKGRLLYPRDIYKPWKPGDMTRNDGY